MLANIRLNLDQVALLFIPENAQLGINEACVVQVIVRSIGMAFNRSASVDDRATFYCYADEISSTVQNVVLGHLSCQSIPTNFVLQGEKYLLRANRKEWNTGKDYRFQWGDEIINAAPEKSTSLKATTLSRYNTSKHSISLSEENSTVEHAYNHSHRIQWRIARISFQLQRRVDLAAVDTQRI